MTWWKFWSRDADCTLTHAESGIHILTQEDREKLRLGLSNSLVLDVLDQYDVTKLDLEFFDLDPETTMMSVIIEATRVKDALFERHREWLRVNRERFERELERVREEVDDTRWPTGGYPVQPTWTWPEWEVG